MKKRFLAMVMSLVIAAGLLAGCGSGSKEAAGETNAASETEEAEQKNEDSASAQEAEGASSNDNKELVELRLIFYGDMSSRREEFFKNEFHDAVLKDLNIDLTVEFLP